MTSRILGFRVITECFRCEDEFVMVVAAVAMLIVTVMVIVMTVLMLEDC